MLESCALDVLLLVLNSTFILFRLYYIGTDGINKGVEFTFIRLRFFAVSVFVHFTVVDILIY